MNNIGEKHIEEFKSWKDELKQYWTQIDKCQEMYEFYKREESETRSDVSLNTTFSIIESMVAKANDSNLNITVNAKGESGLQEVEKWISSVLENALDDPDVAQYNGTFRKKRERFFRDFLVQGNAVATVEWFKKEVNGKVVASNPVMKNRDLKSVIFNPTKTLCDSDIYYLESYVKFSDLKNNELNKKTKKGKFYNLSDVKKQAGEDDIDIEDQYDYSGGKKITKKGAPIRIVERYEDTKYTVYALNGIEIYSEDDPFKLGGHNIVTAMNYVVRNRPYAYGEIDAIYKPVRAQDTIVNQAIDLVNKKLRSSIAVKPGSGIDDFDAIIDVIENGGVIELDPATIGAIPTQDVPAQAFQTVDTMQQAIERAARYSPYSSGVPNSAVDKTQGTATGTSLMMQAQEPNFQVKLDALEESMRAVARMYIKMIANLMSSTEMRYGMLQGKTSEWVKANKALLQGRPIVSDLVKIGMIDDNQAENLTTMEDETTREIDQETGEPIPGTGERLPIPGADKAMVFDVDWLVDVRLDNQSAADKQGKVDRTINLVDFGQKLGVQFSPERTWKYVAEREGEDDPENLLLNEEEKAQMAQQQQMAMMQEQQAQQQEMQQRMAEKQMEMQAKQESETNKINADLNREAMRGQTAQSVAGMRNAGQTTPAVG